MIVTVKFRLYPSEAQEKRLNAIFSIYNRTKRIGYDLLFNGQKGIQQKLMAVCHNNPYVNAILKENKIKLKQQNTWLKKQKIYLIHKIQVVQTKIERVKRINKQDRRLKGLYSRLSSLQNKLREIKLRPIVFGTKHLFRARIRGKISREEFKIRRDASFCCTGKAQHGSKNLNLKILPSRELKIRTFRKEKEKKWIRVPFTVNQAQEGHLQEIFQVEKYTVVVKRQLLNGKIHYFAHITYKALEPKLEYEYEKGAIGLDFNYDFISLVNINQTGKLLSYQDIPFRNLHSFRKGKRDNYASFKLDKVLNYCVNKQKGLIIEDLSFKQFFSYNKKVNRKLSNLKTSMLSLLERKCARKGIAVRRVHPAYTSIIGALKYSWSYNLSSHTLASYVIARKGLGFSEDLPACYEWLLAQVGDIIKPRLNPSSPYRQWAQLYDLFKHYGVTPFRSPDPATNLKRNLLVALDTVLDGLNPATGVPPDNLTAGLLAGG